MPGDHIVMWRTRFHRLRAVCLEADAARPQGPVTIAGWSREAFVMAAAVRNCVITYGLVARARLMNTGWEAGEAVKWA